MRSRVDNDLRVQLDPHTELRRRLARRGNALLLTFADLLVSVGPIMSSRCATPNLPHRILAMLCAVLVLGLAVFSASPEAHSWLHARSAHSCPDHADSPVASDHDCAITLFAHGVQLAAPMALVAPKFVAEVQPIPEAAEFDWVAPRYLHQPERGPPANRVG